MKKLSCLTLVFCGLLACCATSALAVIRVDLPVTGRFTNSQSALLGKVSVVDAERRFVEVTPEKQLKGAASGKFKIVFPPSVNVINSAAVGQPVVFMSATLASIHIADTWIVAKPRAAAASPIWDVVKVDTAAAGKTFPGTTEQLVKVMEEVAAGKSTLLDSFEGKVFTGGVKLLAKLDVTKPTSMVSIDLNGDGKPDLVIATPAGVKAFLSDGEKFTDATEALGLKGVNATSVAAVDAGDARIALLLDTALYANDGKKLTPAPSAPKLDAAHVISNGFDTEAKGKLQVGVLTSEGRLLAFSHIGKPDAPWEKVADRQLSLRGEQIQSAVFGNFAGGAFGVLILSEKSLMFFPVDSEKSTDFTRLTGDDLLKMKGLPGGAKNGILTPIDINGDHRPDLLITADGASLFLINRGFGTYLPDADAGAELSNAVLKALPASLSGIRVRAALTHSSSAPQDLLLLSDDGNLFLAGNATK